MPAGSGAIVPNAAGAPAADPPPSDIGTGHGQASGKPHSSPASAVASRRWRSCSSFSKAGVGSGRQNR